MKHPSIHINLSISALIAHALRRGEGVLAANGALAVTTGKRTGRSPNDKFIVKTVDVADTVAWGAMHQPIAEEVFQALWKRAQLYLQTTDHFVAHLQVGADPHYYFPLTMVSEYAWQVLFAHQLFISPRDFHGNGNKRAWEVVSLPGLTTDPDRDGVASDATLIIHLTKGKVLLCGHHYAGEIKKAMFSVLSYFLPQEAVLPMHCAANVGEKGDVALFFGLSGTGKTALSSDSNRYLIGDDEHGWSNQSIFNFEGGCYAKCINLSAEREAVIWEAIGYGAIMENVVLDPLTLVPQYDNASLTSNTRVAYPVDFVERRLVAQRVATTPEVIIFLTCDLYGVLPPVAHLTSEQAVYYFLSGYTALVGSTEMGHKEAIKVTFSSCFGAPFFLRHTKVYLNLLRERLQASRAAVYLVNTGWTAGSYGGGNRFSINFTRSIIHAILSGIVKKADHTLLPGFQLAIPVALPGIDPCLLDPRKSWQDRELYGVRAKELISLFLDNEKRFDIHSLLQEAAPCLEELG